MLSQQSVSKASFTLLYGNTEATLSSYWSVLWNIFLYYPVSIASVFCVFLNLIFCSVFAQFCFSFYIWFLGILILTQIFNVIFQKVSSLHPLNMHLPGSTAQGVLRQMDGSLYKYLQTAAAALLGTDSAVSQITCRGCGVCIVVCIIVLVQPPLKSISRFRSSLLSGLWVTKTETLQVPYWCTV